MFQNIVETLNIALRTRVVRAVGYSWLVAASLTWMFCPSPNSPPPMHEKTAQIVGSAGYFIECVTLWPLIAFATLHHPRNQSTSYVRRD